MADSSPGTLGGSNMELQALTTIVQALTGLAPDAQRRVLEAVSILVGNAPRASGAGRSFSAAPPAAAAPIAVSDAPSPGLPLDIRQLTEQKHPDSANEMAALVAYYLSEIAGPNERSDTVDAADMEKFFKQARYKLPTNPKMTLVHAKNAGYFDAVGGGRYKLNPVGYNLIAYTLPRSGREGSRPTGTSRRAPRLQKKKATSKKRTRSAKK